jgi:hypothetical protein
MLLYNKSIITVSTPYSPMDVEQSIYGFGVKEVIMYPFDNF